MARFMLRKVVDSVLKAILLIINLDLGIITNCILVMVMLLLWGK